MLKIKDNVDLEELKKFGFEKYHKNCYIKQWFTEASKKDVDYFLEYNKTQYLGIYFTAQVEMFIENDKVVNIDITIFSYMEPLITFQSQDYDFYVQDLIQAGLVEKVEKK